MLVCVCPQVFTGCVCVAGVTPAHQVPPAPSIRAGVGDARLAPDSALREKCPAGCSLMAIFLVIFFVVMILTFIISLPALSGTLR